MAKRLNKNDIIRGRIFDMIANQFGNSVLGVYDGKLRIEIIDEETDEVIQFSLAPTVHKSLVEEEECDKYVSIEDRIKEHQNALKKSADVKKKKKKKTPKEEEQVPDNVETKMEVSIKSDENSNKIDDEEASKIDALMSELGI